jgi:hypothetical protein
MTIRLALARWIIKGTGYQVVYWPPVPVPAGFHLHRNPRKKAVVEVKTKEEGRA